MTREERWALIAPHRARLVALARRHGMSPEDAQDIAHEVMCDIVQYDHLDADTIIGLLVVATRSRCADAVRTAIRRRRILARTLGDERLYGGVEEATCDRAQARTVMAELGRLPERDRVIMLQRIEGRTPEQIAASTGASYSTVDRVLSKTRARLRKIAVAPALLLLARLRRSTAPTAAALTVAYVGFVTLATTAPDVALGSDVATPAQVRQPAQIVATAATAPRVAAVVPPQRAVVAQPRATAPTRGPARPSKREVIASMKGARVTGDTDEPLDGRLVRCVRNGIEYRFKPTGSWIGVVCRKDDSSASRSAVIPAEPQL